MTTEAANGVGVHDMTEPRRREGELDGGEVRYSLREIIERFEIKLDIHRDYLDKRLDSLKTSLVTTPELDRIEKKYQDLSAKIIEMDVQLQGIDRGLAVREGVDAYKKWLFVLITGTGVSTVVSIAGLVISLLKK